MSGVAVTLAKTGVAALVRVERRDAHQAVHAALGLEVAVGVLALHGDGGARDARLVAGQDVHQFHRVSLALGPAGVHAQQHARPVAALGSSCAGVDLEEAADHIVRVAEHVAEFEFVHALFERACGLLQFGCH